MLTGHCRSSSFDSTVSDSRDELLNDLADLRLAVVKLSNISWDLTSSDVLEFLDKMPLDKRHIHIPIDRLTGKTKADMFVELPSMVEAIKCMAKYNRRVLKGRAITVTISSLEELYLAHFLLHKVDLSEFLCQPEAQSLVAICRNYKAHFSRKCAERPFEHVISILRLAPWHQMEHTMCERVFFVVSGATEALADHLARSSSMATTTPHKTNEYDASPTTPAGLLPTSSQLTSELMRRLLAAAQSFPAFTNHQKMEIRRTSERTAPRFGAPISLTVEPKPARHLRRTSIDRILEELGGGAKRSGAVDKLMRTAFDKIMLSSDSNSGSPTEY